MTTSLAGPTRRASASALIFAKIFYAEGAPFAKSEATHQYANVWKGSSAIPWTKEWDVSLFNVEIMRTVLRTRSARTTSASTLAKQPRSVVEMLCARHKIMQQFVAARKASKATPSLAVFRSIIARKKCATNRHFVKIRLVDLSALVQPNETLAIRSLIPAAEDPTNAPTATPTVQQGRSVNLMASE